MNHAALCPSCKRDVVFNTTGGASVCPSCGARFEHAPDIKGRKRARAIDTVIFLAWMFAPAVLALIIIATLVSGTPRPDWNKFFSDHRVLSYVWLVAASVSCYASCAWLTSRFTERRWVRVVIGLSLGAGILVCNVVIAFFGSCAFMPLRS